MRSEVQGTRPPQLLVTGAGGQLGSQIMALADPSSTVGTTSADLDITDESAVRAAVQAGVVVINCAAYTAVDAAETDEAAASHVNETGPAVLGRVCAEVGSRVIHVSTDYVFGGNASSPYEPGDQVDPQTSYGRTKLAGETALHRALPTATVVRTAWVYTGTGNDFVSTMLRLEGQRDTVDVVDDQLGSPTYSADLAAALLELAAHPGSVPSVLHATNAGSATWYDLARAVFEGAGADPDRVRPCSSAQFVRPAPRPAYSVLSTRSWADAGLSPLRDWRDGLSAALAARRAGPIV